MLKTVTRILLILCILSNLFLIVAFLILGDKLNSQYIYVAIYAFIWLGLPGILGVIFMVLKRLLAQGIIGFWLFLKKEIILSVITILSAFVFGAYAYYFIP